MRPDGSVGEVRQRMFREPGREVKGGWLRWVDTAKGGSRKVMDWEQREGREERASKVIIALFLKKFTVKKKALNVVYAVYNVYKGC